MEVKNAEVLKNALSLRIRLSIVTIVLAILCTCDIPWYIYGFPRVSVMHLWTTLGCGVLSCHSDLVWPVRGSLGAPSMKSPLCAYISSSSDVKS